MAVWYLLVAMRKEPFTDRELLKAVLGWPAWLVDYVIGPGPDEIGWPAVAARWTATGMALGMIFVAVWPEMLVRGEVWILTGLAQLALACLDSSNKGQPPRRLAKH